MQTIRFNLFNQIHKGLRALLYDTALQIQHADFSNGEDKQKIMERIAFVNEMFTSHANHEDNQIFPMIAAIAPEIVADFESQHQTDHQLSAGLGECLDRLAAASSREQEILAGSDLLQAFNSFLAFNVEHMKKEETVINQVFWQHFSDAQLMEKARKIAASVPAKEMLAMSAWMLKGLGTQEITIWYKGLRQAAPPPVFENFCRLAESTLTPARWNGVKKDLQVAVPS